MYERRWRAVGAAVVLDEGVNEITVLHKSRTIVTGSSSTSYVTMLPSPSARVGGVWTVPPLSVRRARSRRYGYRSDDGSLFQARLARSCSRFNYHGLTERERFGGDETAEVM